MKKEVQSRVQTNETRRNSKNSCAHAEYDWSTKKIYLYTSRMNSVEDVIRSLIHECVHSTQSKVLFDKYYEDGCSYYTHPFEIEARSAEEEWEIYLNEL